MKITHHENTTCIELPKTSFSIVEVKIDSDIMKCFFDPEKVDVYKLADEIDKSEIGRCIHSSKEKGLILISKIKFDKTAFVNLCVNYINNSI